MWIRSQSDCPEFRAGDNTLLREMINPAKQPLALRYSLAHASLASGTWSTLHCLNSSEVYYILAGAGRMEIDGDQQEVHPGDTVYIPPSARQRILSLGPGPLEFLCIVDPAWRPNDEVILD
jgi:mannose-6-phosphate isomerase-like protein (cupin superfamily)